MLDTVMNKNKWRQKGLFWSAPGTGTGTVKKINKPQASCAVTI